MIAASAAALIGIVVITAITAAYLILAEKPPRGRHGRGTVAARRRGDVTFTWPHGSTTTVDRRGRVLGQTSPDPVLLHALHHEPVWTATVLLPAPGLLPMLPPDPPPADTRPQPAVWTAWGGRTVDQLVDEIFAQACGVTS